MGEHTQQITISPARSDETGNRVTRRTIGGSLGGRDNALNFLRLLLAAAVIVSHSGVLGGFQPIENKAFGPIGGYAVYAFFAISGYLIAGSRMRLPFVAYLWHRALRIMPAFWVCLIITAFVFAPIAATVAGEDWSPISSLGYLIKNSALLMTQDGILNTLQSVPNPPNWNGSVWTLIWEFACYIGAAALLSIPFARKHPVPTLAVLLVTSGIIVAISADRLDWLRLGSFFIAGMLFYFLRDRIPVNAWIAVTCAVVFAGFFVLGIAPYFGQIPFAYMVFWVASVLPIRIGSKNDISYGVYIYGWPVQQVIAVLGGSVLGHLGHSLVSFALAAALGWLSWKLVEKPALTLKNALDPKGASSLK